MGRNLPAPTDSEVYRLALKTLVDQLIAEAYTTVSPDVKPSDIWDVTRSKALKLFRKKTEQDIVDNILARPSST